MLIRRLTTMKYIMILLLMITFTALNAEDQSTTEELPQTQPDKSEFLFKPVEFLPVFKKVSLPEIPEISEDEFKKSIMNVYETLKKSWLKNRMYNELFVLMKTKKNPLFKTFIDDYFTRSSNFDWKVADFEVLVNQYGVNDSREKIEKLLTVDFEYDEEFAVRLPFFFYYQAAFTKDNKTEVIAFLSKMQKLLKKPENYEVSAYYWMSMLLLAAGDDSKLTEVQDWLFNARFNNFTEQLLSSENFRPIIIQTCARNITEKNVDSNAWVFVFERALEGNVIPELDSLFAKTLNDEGFASKSFTDKLSLMNPNLHVYYALISLLNGVDKSYEKVVELIDRLGQLNLFVNLLKPNEFNRKYAPKFLEVVVQKLKSSSYSGRYSAKEAVRRYLLFADDIKSDTIINLHEKINAANLQVSELKEMKTVLMFLAASIKDEVLFEKYFVELQENVDTQQFLNYIRNQFYRSSEYFNDNLKILLGKKILDMLPPDMPFSEYAAFDVLKEFADVKDIAEYILDKIPEWYTKAGEGNRRFFFSYNGTKITFEKIAKLLPKKTAHLIIPMYSFMNDHEGMYDSTRVALQEILSLCGIESAGYLQQLYELTKEDQYVYLISSLKDKEVAGFVYEQVKKKTNESEATVRLLENMRNLLDKEHSKMLLPFIIDEELSLKARLIGFVSMMYIIAS